MLPAPSLCGNTDSAFDCGPEHVTSDTSIFFFLTSLDAVRNWGHVCNIPDTHLGSCPLITTQGKQPGPQPWRKAATTEAITQSQSILPTTFQIR